MKKEIKIIAIIICISCFIIIYLYYENTSLEVTNYSIVSDKIPDEFNGYKIVQISDYHNEKSKRLNKQLLNQINYEKPNAIVITGDIVDSRRTNIDVTINLIKNIKNIAPIYYVTGNHEARIESYNELKQKLVNEGVIILENQADVIEVENNKINIIGINDPKMAHESAVKNSIIINTELKNIDYDKELFTILLSHRPEEFNTYIENNIDLVFTGHAHGGQIRIPFVGGIVAPDQGILPKYTSGVFEDKGSRMIISRGIGNSIIPLRINNRPELVVTTLHNMEE